MFGTTYLGDKKNLSALLDAFESVEQFSPTSASRDERRSNPYDRNWVLSETTIAEQKALAVFLKRQKSARYSASIGSHVAPYVDIVINPVLARKNYPALITWCNNLTYAFKPDYACLTFIPEIRRNPYPTELDKNLDSYLHASVEGIARYLRRGPPGIGMFTWLGKHFIDQIGRDFLISTPNTAIEETDWGGVFIQMASDNLPCELPAEKMIELWQPAMKHLWQRGIFAEQSVHEKGYVYKSGKGPNSVIGGYVTDKKFGAKLTKAVERKDIGQS